MNAVDPQNPSQNHFSPTEAQLGIWLGHQLARDPSVFHAAECVHLRGGLNSETWRQALRLTLEEADALQFAFEEEQGRPVLRRIVPTVQEAPLIDLSATADPHEELLRRARQELQRPLAIEEGELCRHLLFRLGSDWYAWLHIAHHIALDGYGFNLIARRVAENYTKLETGREKKPLFTSLEPVLEEDQAYQSSAEREVDRAFWAQEIEGARGVSLSAKSTGQLAFGVREAQLLSAELALLLREQAKKCAVSWSELFLACVAAWVHQRTGQARFSLGLPVMLRMGSRSLKTPCMAMNIVPFPVNCSQDLSLRELAQQQQTTWQRQKAHSRYRYEHLKAEHCARKERLFGPVVNVMPFDLPLKMGECQVEVEGVSAGPAEDLSIAVIPQSGTYKLILEGHPELYSQQELRDFSSQLLELVERGCSEPERPLKELFDSLLPDAPPPPEWEVKALLSQWESWVQERPQEVALVEGERSFTYAELDRLRKACARVLFSRGVRPGDRVALELPRSVRAVCLFWGVLSLGAAFVVLDPTHPRERKQRILEQAEARLFVHEDPTLAPTEQTWLFSEDELTTWSQAETVELPLNAAELRSGLPAYLIFTSGSTGEPKGVVIQRSALDHFVCAAGQSYGICSSDRVLQFAPLTFDACIEEIFVTAAQGGTLVLRNEEMLESMVEFLRFCEQQKVTVLDLPTAFWHELVWGLSEQSLSLPEYVRLVIIGGEAASERHVELWRQLFPHVKLLNTYGPSEVTVVATYSDLTAPSEWGEPVSIGFPLPGVGACVVSEDGQVLTEPGVSGELYLLGPTLALGYLGREDLTAEKFVHLPGQGRAYRTGDRVQRDGRGRLVFEGRTDEEVKISGYRIAPAEVEVALQAYPGVRACAVLGVKDAQGGKYLVAFVEAEKDEVQVSQLRSFLLQRLPAPLVPSVFELLSQIPKTVHNKLDRRALRAVAERERREGAPLQEEQILALSPEEEQVLAVWRSVLGIQEIGLEEDFFQLGGQSLQVIQVANRLSQAGRPIRVASIFLHPTVREQAQLLLQAQETVEPEDQFVPQQIQLPEDWGRPAQLVEPSAPRRIFLTGASGFVGVHLLAQLAEKTQAQLVCPVRSGSEQEGLERLSRKMESERLAGKFLERVQCVPCDLSDEQKLRQMLAQLLPCDAVVHCAAQVSVTRDYASLFAPNVQVTQSLIEAATAWGAPFHFISTISTLPVVSAPQTVQEKFYPQHDSLVDGYQRSKWHAEQLCEEAGRRGLPVAVYRLGRVTGSRSCPQVPASDLVWRLVRAALAVKKWPDLPLVEPWTPVDTTAEALAGLIVRGSASSPAAAYHVIPNGGVPFAQIRQTLEQRGVRLPVLSLPAWLEVLQASPGEEEQTLVAFFELQKRGRKASSANFDLERIEWSRARSAYPGMDQRPIDEELLNAYLDRLT